MPPLALLIVDQNEMIRSLIARTLMRRFPDAVVEQCSTDAAALLAASRHEPAVIIVGMGAGGRFAAGLVRDLREANGAVPIIATSAELTLAEARQAGASFLIDPENWTQVADVVLAILEGARVGAARSAAAGLQPVG